MHSAWKQLETGVCLSRFSSAVHLKELFLHNFVVRNYHLFPPLQPRSCDCLNLFPVNNLNYYSYDNDVKPFNKLYMYERKHTPNYFQ